MAEKNRVDEDLAVSLKEKARNAVFEEMGRLAVQPRDIARHSSTTSSLRRTPVIYRSIPCS